MRRNGNKPSNSKGKKTPQARQWREKLPLLSCCTLSSERKKRPPLGICRHSVLITVQLRLGNLEAETCFGSELSSEKGFFFFWRKVYKNKKFYWLKHRAQRIWVNILLTTVATTLVRKMTSIYVWSVFLPVTTVVHGGIWKGSFTWEP